MKINFFQSDSLRTEADSWTKNLGNASKNGKVIFKIGISRRPDTHHDEHQMAKRFIRQKLFSGEERFVGVWQR